MTEIVYRVEGTFSASHTLPDHPKCGRLHGHNYTVEVFLKKKVSVSEKPAVDLSALKHSLREILETYDHTHLNDRMQYPSCENIAFSVIADLQARGITPSSVRIWETPLQWAEVIIEG